LLVFACDDACEINLERVISATPTMVTSKAIIKRMICFNPVTSWNKMTPQSVATTAGPEVMIGNEIGKERLSFAMNQDT